jgi:hypothetical protein
MSVNTITGVAHKEGYHFVTAKKPGVVSQLELKGERKSLLNENSTHALSSCTTLHILSGNVIVEHNAVDLMLLSLQ